MLIRPRFTSLILFLIGLTPTLVLAKPIAPRKRDEVRVVVTFKTKISATDRQSLHTRLNTDFLRHFATTNSDLVHVIVGRTLTKTDANARGKALCANYLQLDVVKSCVPAL